MKKLKARHERDPSIAKVLLDSMGVNVIKNFDLMHAYADVDSAAMWQQTPPSHYLALKTAEDVQLRKTRFNTCRNQLFESGRNAESELNKKIHKKHRGFRVEELITCTTTKNQRQKCYLRAM